MHLRESIPIVSAGSKRLYTGSKEFLYHHLCTIASGIFIVFLLFFVPQARNVLFQLPSFAHGHILLVLGFYLFVSLLVLLYGGFLLAIVPKTSGHHDHQPGEVLFRGMPLIRPFESIATIPLKLAGKVYAGALTPIGGSLAISAVLLLFVSKFREYSLYGFDGPFFYFLSLVLGYASIWFFWLARMKNAGATLGFRGDLCGRIPAVLLFTTIVGECCWLLAHVVPTVVSYRNYTIWALLHCAFLILLTARCVDALHVTSPKNVRLRCVCAGVLVLFLMDHDVVGKAGPTMPAAPKPTIVWLKQLLNRLESVPPDSPAIVVAASGGGSRAALFTALVLEGLAAEHEPGATNRTLAENVVLISSVSGGSLATAYYVASPGETLQRVRTNGLWNSFPRQIAAEMAQTAAQLKESACAKTNAHVFDRVIEDCINLNNCLHRGDSHCGLPVPFDSRFIDDMCTDFMAPVLRGVLLPGLRRGQSLAYAWERLFGWENRNNRSRGGRAPLVLFNASDAEHGTRFVVGFPQEPNELLTTNVTSLSVHDPACMVSLAEAVRLSANFPWILQVAHVEERERKSSSASAGIRHSGGIHVLDGGVVDNTGLDTLTVLVRELVDQAKSNLGDFHALPAASQSAARVPLSPRSSPAEAQEVSNLARAIVAEFQRRGVILVEIDSGAKKRGFGPLSRLLPTVFEPVEAFELSTSANAMAAKQTRLAEVSQLLVRDLPSASGLHTTNQNPNRVAPPPSTALFPVTFSCDRYGQVMTAWALGPKDKASVWTTFLLEYHNVMPRLKSLIADLRQQNEDSRLISLSTHEAKAQHLVVNVASSLTNLFPAFADVPSGLDAVAGFLTNRFQISTSAPAYRFMKGAELLARSPATFKRSVESNTQPLQARVVTLNDRIRQVQEEINHNEEARRSARQILEAIEKK